MNRALHGVGFDDGAAALVGEQIHCVCGVVPEQVIGPAAGLAECIHIGSAKKISLHIELLEIESAGADLLIDVLVTGVKTPGVATHGDQPSGFLQSDYLLGALEGISQRNFYLHMLARLQAS